jgi:hypothetical protein
MRIAMLSWESQHAIPVGGIAAHATELSAALAAGGHEVHVFTRMGAGQEPYSRIDGVHVHRCPFDPNVEFLTYIDRAEVRARCAVGSDERMVLFVGRLAWQKGPDLLLDAAPEIVSDHHEARFAIVGAGDRRPSLEEGAHRSGCGGLVRFLGERRGRDLVDLFHASDLVCVPSRNEPFGIVVLEAWSASRPVVVTRSGGPGEFVRDGETGVMVEPVREGIAQGVEALLDNPGGPDRSQRTPGRRGTLLVGRHRPADRVCVPEPLSAAGRRGVGRCRAPWAGARGNRTVGPRGRLGHNGFRRYEP